LASIGQGDMRTEFFVGFLALIFVVVGTIAAGAVGVGGSCGGVAGAGCDAGLWCEQEADTCGNAAAAGTCVRIPHSCGWSLRPVCACSGKTYGNDCERLRAKVNKAHNGACGPHEPSRRARETPDSEPDARQGGR
jgi:hypothetical protein